MTHANPDNYAAAQALIVAGTWQVDIATGQVFGVQGRPFRRTNTDGYIQIKYRDPTNWRVEHSVLAHRVLWETAHGPLDPVLTINHKNGNKQDNSAANLEVLTQADNVRHARRTGLTPAPVLLTHCHAGHPFSEANTRHVKGRSRICRTCDRDRTNRYRAERDAKQSAAR